MRWNSLLASSLVVLGCGGDVPAGPEEPPGGCLGQGLGASPAPSLAVVPEGAPPASAAYNAAACVEVPVAIPLGVGLDANSELAGTALNISAALLRDDNPERWSIHIIVTELVEDGSQEVLGDRIVPVSEMVVTFVSQSDAFVDVSWTGGNSVSQNSDIEACARVLSPAERYVGAWTCDIFIAGSF